ncbi:hypothetical protein Hanom_Chr03g00218911 [Helianthus anomalus]
MLPITSNVPSACLFPRLLIRRWIACRLGVILCLILFFTASPTRSPSSRSRIGIDGEFSEDSANWMKKDGSGRLPAVVTTGGTDLKQAIEALNDGTH